jgi:hypothetical protein
VGEGISSLDGNGSRPVMFDHPALSDLKSLLLY